MTLLEETITTCTKPTCNRPALKLTIDKVPSCRFHLPLCKKSTCNEKVLPGLFTCYGHRPNCEIPYCQNKIKPPSKRCGIYHYKEKKRDDRRLVLVFPSPKMKFRGAFKKKFESDIEAKTMDVTYINPQTVHDLCFGETKPTFILMVGWYRVPCAKEKYEIVKKYLYEERVPMQEPPDRKTKRQEDWE